MYLFKYRSSLSNLCWFGAKAIKYPRCHELIVHLRQWTGRVKEHLKQISEENYTSPEDYFICGIDKNLVNDALLWVVIMLVW